MYLGPSSSFPHSYNQGDEICHIADVNFHDEWTVTTVEEGFITFFLKAPGKYLQQVTSLFNLFYFNFLIPEIYTPDGAGAWNNQP